MTIEAPPADTAAAHVSLPRLLLLFLRIGIIGFGGGMAVVALIERELIQKRKLLKVEEFLHGVGLGQVLGSFAVNAAFFVGYRLYGAVGGTLAAAVFLTPSLVMVTALSHLYFRYHAIPALDGAVAGLGPVVIALILDACWSLGRRVLRSWYAGAVGVAALAAAVAGANAVWILVAAGAAGLIRPAVRAGRLRSIAPVALVWPATLGPLAALPAVVATFFKIGLVFFGGGFVLIPVLHQHLVTRLGWLTPREFMDGVAISNLTPGPIAVLSTFAGYRMAGVTGAVLATVALMLPALVLMLAISRQYQRHSGNEWVRHFLAGVNPAVVALVLSAAVMLRRDALRSWQDWIFAAAALAVIGRLRWHPAILLACGAAAGYFRLLG